MQVVWTEAASNDLAEIRDYIGADNPIAAGRVAVQILSAVERLETYPYRGRPGREPGSRELIVYPYVIVYRVKGELIESLRVWHGAQDRL